MRAEAVALILGCVECDARWLPADGDRWEAYLTDDEPPELAFYCPARLLLPGVRGAGVQVGLVAFDDALDALHQAPESLRQASADAPRSHV
jgi:hypothetical protein